MIFFWGNNYLVKWPYIEKKITKQEYICFDWALSEDHRKVLKDFLTSLTTSTDPVIRSIERFTANNSVENIPNAF